MSDVICISYTPSREYRDAVNRERRIINDRAFGATAGDTWYMGFRDYDEVDPFARYRDEEELKPITNPFWRARIEKAKRDRAAFSAEWAIRDAAEAITDEEFDVWFDTITKG